MKRRGQQADWVSEDTPDEDNAAQNDLDLSQMSGGGDGDGSSFFDFDSL